MEQKQDNLELLDGFINYTGEGRNIYNIVFSDLKRFLRNPDAAEDVMIETQFKVYLKREEYDSERALMPWLKTIAINKARDYMRREKRRKKIGMQIQGIYNEEEDEYSTVEISNEQLEPLESIIRLENISHVRKALYRLPKELRIPLRLVYLKGYRYQEVAKKLGIPEGTIKSRLPRKT